MKISANKTTTTEQSCPAFNGSEIVTIKGRLIWETEMAVLVRQTREGVFMVEAWIPRAECKRIAKIPKVASDFKKGVDTEIELPKWLSHKKGLWEER